MKRLLILLVLFIAGNLAAQSRKQVKELKIKSMTETTTLYRDGKETSTYKSEYKTFDKEGNTLSSVAYNADGSVHRKVTSKYVGKDQVEEVVENNSGDDGDDDNSPPKKYKKTTWKYNNKGDKTEEVEYDAAGNVTKKITYAYNNSGDRMFEITYDGAGKVLKKIAYGYDAKGLKTEKKVFGPGGEALQKSVRYTYTY